MLRLFVGDKCFHIKVLGFFFCCFVTTVFSNSGNCCHFILVFLKEMGGYERTFCFFGLFILFLRKGSLLKLFPEHQHVHNDSLLFVKHVREYTDDLWCAHIRREYKSPQLIKPIEYNISPSLLWYHPWMMRLLEEILFSWCFQRLTSQLQGCRLIFGTLLGMEEQSTFPLIMPFVCVVHDSKDWTADRQWSNMNTRALPWSPQLNELKQPISVWHI